MTINAIGRSIPTLIVVLLSTLIVASCVTPIPGNERASNPDGVESAGREQRPARSARHDSETRQPAPWVSSLLNLQPGERVLEYSEGYFVETPWFGVSAIILEMRKSNAPTVIVLREEMLLARVIRQSPRVRFGEAPPGRAVRFRLNVGLYTGESGPFLDNQLVDELGLLAEQ